jgi:hypothetical protein
MGGTPVGSPIIGWIGETFGARWTLVGGGLLTILGVGLSAVVFLRARRTTQARGVTSGAPVSGAPGVLTP